jgi:hypothetical protein
VQLNLQTIGSHFSIGFDCISLAARQQAIVTYSPTDRLIIKDAIVMEAALVTMANAARLYSCRERIRCSMHDSGSTMSEGLNDLFARLE